ncbi:pyocin knob domain-containing protein [Flavobacterium sp.]|uniref:pyocin knob domain-containing protein n=1 Tax=Flavobacterium sp. TaxID=239 RepID=UPI003A928AB0
MIIINSVSNTLFSFNGIEYFRNYISVVRGERIEIFNCYERDDVMLPLTHYSEVSLNGITYNNASDLQSVLQTVIYSRATLGSDEVEVVEQNNVGKIIYLDYVSGSDLLTQVLGDINSQTTLISATDNPVYFTAYKSSTTASVAQKLRFQFMGGKGTWGAGGSAVLPSHLYQLPPESLLPEDITANSKSNVISLGQITNETEFLTKVNSTLRDLTDTSKLHYFSYSLDSILYIKRFTGQPGEYDGTQTVLTETDFNDATNSNVQPGLYLPTLKDITAIDSFTDTPITITDNNTGDNITFSGSSVKHTSVNGSKTTLDYQPNSEDVTYSIPAKSTDDVFAMQSDVNGITIVTNQSASELYLKNVDGTTLATINLGFLNNEGTTFFYNETSEKLELKNDDGDVLSEVPVSAFVANLMQSVNFNGATPQTLEFKDAEGNVVDSVTFTVSNIQGLQAALDAKVSYLDMDDFPALLSEKAVKSSGVYTMIRRHVISTETDLDNYNEAGYFLTPNGGVINLPDGFPQTRYALTVNAANAVYGSQILICCGLDGFIAIRRRSGSEWSKWICFTDSNIGDSEDLNNYTNTGVFAQTQNTQAASGTNYPEPYAGMLTVHYNGGIVWQTYLCYYGTNNLYHRGRNSSGNWSNWVKEWDSSDFSQADIDNWNTTFEWGNHASAGYAQDSNVVKTTDYQPNIQGVKNWIDRQIYNSSTDVFTDLYRHKNLKSFSSNSGALSGSIRIAIPMITTTMWDMKVKVVEYSAGFPSNAAATSEFVISGYGTNLVANKSVRCTNSNHYTQVRHGRNVADDKTVIYIDKDSDFRYPKVIIESIDFYYTDYDNMNHYDTSKYECKITTDETDFVESSIITNSQFIRDSYYLDNNISSTYTRPVNSGGYGLSGASINDLPIGTYTATLSTNTIDTPFTSVGGLISIGATNAQGTQILGSRTGNELWFRPYSTNYGSWYRLWNSGDFTQSDVSNWNTAYNRGDFRDYGLGSGLALNTALENDILIFSTTGIFRVASTAINLPETDNGFIYRMYRGGNNAYVVFYSDSGKIFKNIKDGSSWSGWERILSSGDITIDSSIGDAQDLNNFTKTGNYSQTLNAQAVTGSNYPVPYAGMLEVFSNNITSGGGIKVYQKYHSYNNELYIRGNSAGIWSSWSKITKSSDLSGYLAKSGGTITGAIKYGNPSANQISFLGTQLAGTEIGYTAWMLQNLDWDTVNSKFTKPRANLLSLALALGTGDKALRLMYAPNAVSNGDEADLSTVFSVDSQGRIITQEHGTSEQWNEVYSDKNNYLRNQADGAPGNVMGGASFTDLNNLLTGIAWVSNTISNLPSGQAFHVISLAGTDSYQSQLALRSSNFYFRSKEADSWQSWKRIWHSGDFTQSNIDNWNTAYNRGDFKDYGIGVTAPVTYPMTDLNDTSVPNGTYAVVGASTSNTPITNSGTITVERYSTYITQKYQAVNQNDVVRMFIRHYKAGSASWTPWREIWTDENFSPNDKAEVNDTLSFKGTIPSGDNINNYTVNGFYSTDSSTVTNLPVEDKGILTVASNGNYSSQTYTNYNSNEFYFRTSNPAGGWNSWERAAKSSERIINDTLSTPPSSASLNALYPSANATFTVIAPNVEKGNMYVKTDDGWLVFTGNRVY